MKLYTNRSGGSNVSRYEYGEDYIIVEFRDRAKYEYTDDGAGKDNILKMKSLADQGTGLNSFIINFVMDKFTRKWN